MSQLKSHTYQSKEQQLLQQIDKTKQALVNLRQKHKIELGELAYQAGLDKFDKTTLTNAFLELATQLNATSNKTLNQEKTHDDTNQTPATITTT